MSYQLSLPLSPPPKKKKVIVTYVTDPLNVSKNGSPRQMSPLPPHKYDTVYRLVY